MAWTGVRIWDLNTKFLAPCLQRGPADFAQELYNRYQTVTGLPLMPAFVPEMKKRQAQMAHIWE